ncbi:hypothetical protein PLESTB_000258900 [Pleodorina starrii]|uniref:Uncharacterized protein n=1 Tax=Pleodorina starrii TaxID=330485 RepID=A0A9W6BCE4_9CHLO|nr:hypothetical protein PLESTM_001009800 [Pleodorina starrii]GLC49562.1 hypothetical protein PLESTB_000258900 [Pleodorina starrii]GLC77277.1 hypothetical protein PLESTF_001907800 [Pleodorina starrii]
MATAIVGRPAHRRQGSDVTSAPLPALGAATSTVTLDGRLLEIPDVQQRGRLQKDDDLRPMKAQPKGAVARPPPIARAPPDKAPMTPPRVSGVSLAPLPNLEHHNGGSGNGGDKSPGATSGATKLQRRPSLTSHIALGGKAPPPPAAVTAAAGGCGGAATAAGGCGVGAGCGAGAHGSQSHGQLIAEGRSMRTRDPWIVAYMDINGDDEVDDDSLCVTPPPRLNIQSLARSDTHGAFGPLTPCPLSPSILTVCGQPGHDDQFAFNSSLELFDMRTCQSPKLPPV